MMAYRQAGDRAARFLVFTNLVLHTRTVPKRFSVAHLKVLHVHVMLGCLWPLVDAHVPYSSTSSSHRLCSKCGLWITGLAKLTAVMEPCHHGSAQNASACSEPLPPLESLATCDSFTLFLLFLDFLIGRALLVSSLQRSQFQMPSYLAIFSSSGMCRVSGRCRVLSFNK